MKRSSLNSFNVWASIWQFFSCREELLFKQETIYIKSNKKNKPFKLKLSFNSSSSENSTAVSHKLQRKFVVNRN